MKDVWDVGFRKRTHAGNIMYTITQKFEITLGNKQAQTRINTYTNYRTPELPQNAEEVPGVTAEWCQGLGADLAG